MVLDAATIMDLVINFSYFGIFIGSFLSSLTLFFPVPSFLFVLSAGAFLNPLLVGISAGAGSAVGEMIGYPIGRGINYSIKENAKYRKFSIRIKKWFDRRLGPLVIFLFALTPLPDDFVIIFCGAINYGAKKTFLPLLAGKIVFSLVLAYAGFYGISFIV